MLIKLPVQPNHTNVSAIILCSGRTLNEHDNISLSEDEPKSVNVDSNANEEKKVPSNPTASNNSSSLNVVRNYITKPPFPSRLAPSRKEFKNDKEILEVLRIVEINLPLLTAIKLIRRYNEILKELCTNKRSRDQEKAMVSGNISALLKKNLPEKCRDLGMFSLPCTIEIHDKFEELRNQAFIEYSENEFVNKKDKPSEMLGGQEEGNDISWLHILYRPSEEVLRGGDNGMELQVLPSHLKYICILGDKNTLPVIISRPLTEEQKMTTKDLKVEQASHRMDVG
ncbi:uncharacterized protein E5676_scaffold108G00240 [Cucumis melo var. makuwa]|uniref:Uncharacterized protein n=1 Tax=Cucumis melo var. makuwa TaxID=1194695 RepID=A0A5A7URV7_CUCMM|nr:uncharacterized protein E6C27_scaffold226G00510 [Cucumis melo var. makuwa]TYK05219.1 uncharacterized protein E5676_scaffold108G00240 [Cucumis melo var. makuwa]